MFNQIRFACLGGAALALSACSVPQFEVTEALGLQTAQPEVASAEVAVPAPVAAPAPTVQPVQVAQQEVAEEVEEAPRTSRWQHQRIGGTPDLGESDESGGWGG